MLALQRPRAEAHQHPPPRRRQCGLPLLAGLFLAWNLFAFYRGDVIGGGLERAVPGRMRMRSDHRLYPSDMRLINLTDFRCGK